LTQNSTIGERKSHVHRTAIFFIGLCVLIGICGQTARAQTINAASCNLSDVQKALNSVNQATATVVIPSGSCSWSSALSYTVPSSVTSLTVQGQTVVDCTGTAGTSTFNCTATDNTVLVDSYNASNQPILKVITGGPSTAFRITGLTFQGGTIAYSKPDGYITFGGSTQNLRIDHIHMNNFTYSPQVSNGGLTIYTMLNGVLDHDLFQMYSEGNAIRVYSGSGDYGDSSWAQPSQWGTSNFIYAENDYFFRGAANDCNEGGRMVIRYSTILDNPYAPGDEGLWQGHQIGQGVQRFRGCRAMEVYHNYIYNPGTSNAFGVAGGAGTALVWANNITNYNFDLNFQNDRTLAGNACGGGGPPACTNPPNGIGYCGNGSNGTASPWDGNSNIMTGYPCIDQIGRGQGDLVNGQYFPGMANTANGCPGSSVCNAWPHQMREPWYVWNEQMTNAMNTYTNVATNGVQMMPNRDFYINTLGQTAQTNGTTPFNGTSGIGWGTRANRPTTCTAGPGGTYDQSPTGSYGVGYFGTDTNTLYVCTSTNTWTAIYTPYTYPHPLVAGGATLSGNTPGAPTAPTGLVATVQ
jgi:hypothetical protein